MSKPKFYSLKKILAKDAQYNIIIGERSNGKTFACLNYALKDYCTNGNQFAIIRRFREDFRNKRADTYFNNIVDAGLITSLTKGLFDKVVYKSSKWYLAKFDEKLDKDVTASNPFAYAFALSESEHDKSASFPKITNIIFDEFLSRGFYLNDEFVLFMNTLSTIIRHRDNVKIFMLGNTVNKYCPYFAEMGLRHIPQMKQGAIDVYTYGNSRLKVAVEYAASVTKNKSSDIYFAFDNPKLNMITSGEWEISIYPHLPCKYQDDDILYTYFIVFGGDILQCEIISKDELIFTYIHQKTTPLKEKPTDMIYSLEYSPLPNHSMNILKPVNELQKRIAQFFTANKVFYQNNDVGEIVRNFIMQSQKVTII